MNKVVATIVLLSAFCAGPALARDARFLPAELVGAQQILPTPPAPDSEAAAADLAELHRIETTRTPADIARAKADAEDKSVFAFRNVFGDKFTKENLPGLAALTETIIDDQHAAIEAAKTTFHRQRPYNVDKTLHPVCKTTEKDDSYPSGHATLGYVLGLTLVDIMPERRDAILARAEEYGRGRMICGVHFPSDVAAGRLAAYAIHAMMSLDARYRAELASAKAEVRRALGSARVD